MEKVNHAPTRAVLFDFGDTLVHFGRVDTHAMFAKSALRTYHMWAKHNRRMPGYRRFYLHHWFAMRWAFLKAMVFRREADTMRMLHRACRKLWLEAPKDFFDELAWHWYRPLVEVATVEDETLSVLRKLQDDGYRLGIVSNTFVPGFVLDRHMEGLGLLEYFPTRIYSYDVGYRKPNPRIFQIALEQIGVPAERAVFIGDLPRVDVRGAMRAGLHAIWRKPKGAKGDPPTGALAINSIAELPNTIDQLFA